MFPALSQRADAASLRDMLRLALRPRRVSLFLIAIPMGLAFSIAVQTRPAPGIVMEPSIRSVSAETILHLEEEQRYLKDSIKSLREQVAVEQREAAARRSQLTGLSSEIEAQKLAAGFTPLRGPGVRVTLDDSQSRSVPVGTDPNLLLVHDYDLRDVVSILWANGAEAIAINGQRLVINTSIFCVGTTILVNDTRLSPPYVVDAIAPPNVITVLNQPTVMERFKTLSRRYGLPFGVTAIEDTAIPAFDGHLNVRFAGVGSR
jgi:uncharacterized protein YlxW (UPF0749 family)